MNIFRISAVCLATVFFSAATYAQDPAHATEKRMQQPGNDMDGKPRIAFLTQRLGTDHAEGISMIDMNGDGFLDLLSGAYWYENPGARGGEWKQHQFRTVGIHNEFVSDCGEWVVDVDHDGLPDLVTVGWISNGLWWYRNPGPKATAAGEQWKAEKITDSFDTEGGAFADINGDGKPDLALAHYNRAGVLWVDFAGSRPKVHHVGNHVQDGHGIGIADINGDGKADILTTHGWFEQVDASADKWIWHPDWTLGDAGFPILDYDVNHDGRMDLIYGQGHGYGLYWLEQAGTREHPQWIRHTIDESFSQSHALALLDLNGEGTPLLVTGKRYRGHSGGDPGSYDPTVVYAYRLPDSAALAAAKSHTDNGAPSETVSSTMVISNPTANPMFERIALSVNGTATIGTQIVAADFDHDGDLDFATAGKLGVHVFENLKINTVSKSLREEMQPINRAWPFPGEGSEVPQEDGPPVPQ
ncbi:FG-GAP repeat domain-containing protein [Silvibacterium dinghuense]|uniref:VCBS repeat-containing protein n=1 Tax=Silvibacterium dinghuense TaxID=1560006 RepID=A0A4Q1S8D8_9BACT|nr:VCBS repeat-containing protein [Silvibacterium dinghuense]RXS92807.1 VCBS repeat-containing protein [Silvibacterium dinghuense]